MNREAIYSALYARLQTVAGFTTVSRRLRHWVDVSAAETPYIGMIQRREDPDGSRMGMPLRWTLHVDFYLYAHTTDPRGSPAIILNPLLDAVMAAFSGDVPTNTVTLGGQVYHCRVSGSIETDEGVLGDLAVAIIPLMIITPD